MFRILQATMRSLGVHLSSAKSGSEALLHIEKNGAPDAIILDFTMPDMDGVETLRRIRNLPSGKTIPVLMLTASDQTLIRKDAEGLNVHAFMTKPFGPNSLLQTVKEMLHSGV
jgi:CheY-like chemotaxis protein